MSLETMGMDVVDGASFTCGMLATEMGIVFVEPREEEEGEDVDEGGGCDDWVDVDGDGEGEEEKRLFSLQTGIETKEIGSTSKRKGLFSGR